MESSAYSKYHLKEIADVKGFTMKNTNIRYDKNIIRVNRFIPGPDCVTSHTEGPIAPTQFAIIPKENTSLKREFLSFIFESGMFYAYLSARQGKKAVALETSESDLMSFDVPIPTTEIQLLIVKQQVAFEWAKRNINDGYKYSGLRMATYDEIRHILAYELYYPNQAQLMNIHPLKVLSKIADILDDPQILFETLLFERPEMMEQIKRFRSYIQFR